MTPAELVRNMATANRRLWQAVDAEFEVVDDRRARVRRMEVVRIVAGRLGVRVTYADFVPRVNRVVAALGAVPVRHGNKALWRGLRRRE